MGRAGITYHEVTTAANALSEAGQTSIIAQHLKRWRQEHPLEKQAQEKIDAVKADATQNIQSLNATLKNEQSHYTHLAKRYEHEQQKTLAYSWKMLL